MEERKFLMCVKKYFLLVIESGLLFLVKTMNAATAATTKVVLIIAEMVMAVTVTRLSLFSPLEKLWTSLTTLHFESEKIVEIRVC